MRSATLHRAEALTATAFRPFGEVMEAGPEARQFAINGGNTMRFHDLARLDAGPDGRLMVSIFRGQPRKLPFEVCMMERHPHGSQAFMPLSGQPYLVVVAPPGAPPSADTIRVFLASPQQGVNYAAGVWHHPLLALHQPCDFLVLDRDGSSPNCDEVQLPVSVMISL
ncbi:ureidoglycolate lyase [Aquitalea sp. LB_tupeE]|uniref:ureidoglycolate lyase n=1 Tax=Aquitalea sp. LB_tupeE TaxID=2748078 RepID=UPI0015BD176B|nr:ureidoglycolate lyase [Aquitalea sp. LB_tupeE]NWK79513.1 ureidoglycolate lyase [Aquitalea sp. LB_tupeE]